MITRLRVPGRDAGAYVPCDEVEERDGDALRAQGDRRAR